jgi:hypothetical protein
LALVGIRDLQFSAMSARLLSLLAFVFLTTSGEHVANAIRFLKLIPLLSGVVNVDDPVELIERRLIGVYGLVEGVNGDL